MKHQESKIKNIIMLTGLYQHDKLADLIRKSHGKLSLAANNHQWRLIYGIEKNIEYPLSIVNSYFIPAYPTFKELYIPHFDWSHKPKAKDVNTSFLNLKGIKHFSRYYSINQCLRKQLSDEPSSLLLCYSMSYSFLKAISEIKKVKASIKTCLIIPDLPSLLAKYGDLNMYKRLTTNFNIKSVTTFAGCFDSYVLLSEQMKELFDVGNKPCTIVDGLFDEDFDLLVNRKTINFIHNSTQLKRIVYTGSLHKEYGIKELITAFCQIQDARYRLIIAGSGNYEMEVKKSANKDKRICFLGVIDRIKAQLIQSKATLLVNPRSETGFDAKYSFPSKTIEYLLSSRPVLMSKLPSMSKEYDPYIFYINSFSNLTDAITEICEKQDDELDRIGRQGREFVLKNKNSIIQTKKILQMIESL